MVEVIGKDTLEMDFSDYSFTRVRIINQYAGEYIGKQLWIIDAKGVECCLTRLHYDNLGDKFIIKGYFSEGKAHLELSACSTNVLKIEGNNVVGDITISKGKRWSRWTSLLKSITFGLINREKNKKEIKPQKMTIEKIIKVLKERLR